MPHVVFCEDPFNGRKEGSLRRHSIGKGGCTVVESTKEVPFEDGMQKRDILFPLEKEVKWLDKEQVRHKKVFYLVDTGACMRYTKYWRTFKPVFLCSIPYGMGWTLFEVVEN